MSGDNGKLEPEKTPEQLAQERLERYTKDPTSFTEHSELAFAVKRTSKGMAFLMGAMSLNELKVMKYDIDMQIDNAIYSIIAEQKSKVIPAKGSMLHFARRR
jgi:hypothetical protein